MHLCAIFFRKVFSDSCVTLLTNYMVRHTNTCRAESVCFDCNVCGNDDVGENITDAATMAATVAGHSAKVICHWVYNCVNI